MRSPSSALPPPLYPLDVAGCTYQMNSDLTVLSPPVTRALTPLFSFISAITASTLCLQIVDL